MPAFSPFPVPSPAHRAAPTPHGPEPLRDSLPSPGSGVRGERLAPVSCCTLSPGREEGTPGGATRAPGGGPGSPSAPSVPGPGVQRGRARGRRPWGGTAAGRTALCQPRTAVVRPASSKAHLGSRTAPPAGVWRRCASLKGRPPPWGPTGSEAVDATAADVFLGGFGLKEPGKHVTPFQRKGPGLAGRTRRTGSTCGPGQQVGRSVHPGGHAGRPPALWPLSPRLSCPAVTGTQDGAQRRDRQRNPRPLSSGPSRSSETRTR